MLTEQQILALYDILQLHAQITKVKTPKEVQDWLDDLCKNANGNIVKSEN
jgi:hypothetical protein